jgi:Calcineurin-like phosphoesterase/Purple acid Phosphatase, N-terminal domain
VVHKCNLYILKKNHLKIQLIMKPSFYQKALLLLFISSLTLTAFSQTTIVPYGATWKYLADGTNQGTAWRASGFNDAAWPSGAAELGYGDGDEATCVPSGGSGGTLCLPTGNKYITTYFRHTVNIANTALYSDFTLNLIRDDGAVVYVNGTQVAISNMPASPGYTTVASSNVSGAAESQVFSFTISTASFVNGNNTIAVEIHQDVASSSDVSFNLQLIGNLPATNLINHTDTWKYLDNGTDQGTAWRAAAFNDAAWAAGPGELGYGETGQGTTVSFGPSAINKYITTYFRKTFNITGINGYGDFTFSLMRDDGAVVYINGVEVYRSNLPAGTIAYNTLAPIAAADDGNTAQVFNLSKCASYLVEGNNTIAVEMHQNDITSSDLTFSLQVVANPTSSGTPTLTRNPYLQMGRQTAITIRWRTDVACLGRVELGSAVGSYTISTTDETCATTEHEVTVTGLTPDTKYFYRIGTTTPLILQATASNFFTTLPPANTTRKLRFAVFGDCGRNDNSFQSGSLTQYQRYLTDNSIDAADAMLLLGDNAYTNGTEAEYISNFFTPFGTSILRNHKLYPTPGNHDYDNGGQPASRTLPYYQNFTMPTAAEIGGLASGTEAYYSYDIGDVHFLSLDSYGTEASSTKLYDTTGPQVTWVKADLAATTKKWVVAYWHHPPYTKGSHDSDGGETDLRDIRENFIRILERNGVDMILCGHSHDYERSYLLKGYYKTNPGDAALTGVNFNVGTHAVNNSSGKYDGTANSCTYTTASGKVHHGTVYVLSGSAGANGSVVTGTSDPWPHNALPFSIDEGGMFYFEVDNNRLDAKFISRIAGGGGAAVIGDQFTIMKDVNVTSSMNVVNGNSVTLTASWPGNYNWTPGAATTRSINVTPPSNTTTVYTVADAQGCIQDQFSVTANGTLPVSLIAYDAKLIDSKVKVSWTTASEVNTRSFTIERSANGTLFTAIGTVNAAGNSTTDRSYEYIDAQPLSGTSYYRLVQTDIDGRNNFAGVKRIDNNPKLNFDVKVLSGQAGKLVLQVNSQASGVYNLSIIDVAGRRVVNETVRISSGSITKSFNLNPGVYIWEVRNQKEDAISQKVIVQ